VYEAADRAEAVELIERDTIPVELVVSDIIMPRLNGVELMKALAVSSPGVPVILMSAYAQGELAEMGVVGSATLSQQVARTGTLESSRVDGPSSECVAHHAD
jgi:CheY-like chemotaxis protein